MPNRDSLLATLQAGRPYTWTVPYGGDLASMRAAIRHGQTLTTSPVTDPSEIQVGDIVLLKWHKSYIMHLVQEIQGEQFLIVNSVGKVNGWVPSSDILGRVTQVVDPPPRPAVPEMLDELEAACRWWMAQAGVDGEDGRRLECIVDDLRWYAGRLGAERWYKQPRSHKWSFEQNLWHLTRQAGKAATLALPNPVWHWTDRGKECVGLAAEIIALFEDAEPH